MAVEWDKDKYNSLLGSIGDDLDDKIQDYMARQEGKNNTGTLLEEFLKFSSFSKDVESKVILAKASNSPNPLYGKFCHYVYHSKIGYQLGEKGNQKIHRSYILTQGEKSNAIQVVIDDMNNDFISEGKGFWSEVSDQWKNFLADHDEDVTVDDALNTLDDAIDEIDHILTQKDE